MMKLITDLPADVLWVIANHLQCADLKHLRFVNHILHDIASENVLKSIRVPYYQYRRINMIYAVDSDGNTIKREDPDKVTDSMPVSRRMPSGGTGTLPALSQHTRQLIFKPGGWAFTNPDDDIAVDIFADLMSVISHLTSLEAFVLSWDYNHYNHGRIRGILEGMIADTAAAVIRATGGKLKKLTITASTDNMHIPKALCSARGLEYFKYTQDGYSYFCGADRSKEKDAQHSCRPSCPPLPETITTIITNNLHFKELNIFSGCVGAGNGPEYFLTPNLINLQSLTFAGMSLQSLPKGLLPSSSLRNLRHLHVHNTYSEHNLDVLWKSLHAAGTILVTLRTKQISPSFIDYTSSFSGLEKLTIDGVEDSPVYTQTAGSFFDAVLPRHGGTLRYLQLSCALGTMDAPQWAFQPTQWLGALQHLNVLEELWLFVSEALLSTPHSRPEASKQLILLQQVLGTLFDDPSDGGTVNSHTPVLVPALKKLVVCRPILIFGCGFSAGQYEDWERALFASVISKLRVQVNRLEVLEITSIDSAYKLVLAVEREKLKAQGETQIIGQTEENAYLEGVSDDAELQIDLDIKLSDGPYMFVPIKA